jgi:superfamily II DNA/RNA helicase
MLVVTPTVNLAYQIQREVNRLWPMPITMTEEGRSSSAMHVVEQQTEEEDETPLLCVKAMEAPILAGTPWALVLKLVAEMRQSNQMASLLSNMKTIVLDESDHSL